MFCLVYAARHTKNPEWWPLPYTVTSSVQLSLGNHKCRHSLRRLKLVKASIHINLPYVKLRKVIFLTPSGKSPALCYEMWVHVWCSTSWVFAGSWTGQCCLQNAVFPTWLGPQLSCCFCILWNYNIQKKSHLPSAWAFLSSNGIHEWCVQVDARTMECGFVKPSPKPNERMVTGTETFLPCPKLKLDAQELAYQNSALILR